MSARDRLRAALRVLPSVFVAMLVAVPAFAGPGNTPPAAEAFVRAARSQRLSTDTTWLRLGHYRSGIFGGYGSEADGRPIFLAKDGKTDPELELEATIRGFFQPLSGDPDTEHPLCRFPARFLFLNGKLHFDRAALPRPDCHSFREFVTTLNPDSITLVFSSYYLNNPASSFGHTFLRVNKKGRHGADHNDLLDYGVDFSATVDTSNAFIYGMKGLFGLFPGTFHKLPYYLKVREYNDYESRDLWEYDLSLNRAQVAMVVAHLWELGSTYFAYYYLSENCSYHILGALEVADPKIQLIEPLHWPVLPADTVKVLFKNPGLVRRVHFRPSSREVFESRLRDLNGPETRALSDLVSNPDAKFPASFTKDQRVLVLDAALDLADSKYARELLKSEAERDADIEAEKQRLLERRAEEAVVSDEKGVAPPFRSMPHLAHGARRFGLGPGYSRDQGYFQVFRMRLALHDLADGPRGLPETAEIEFIPFALRYYIESPHVEVEEFSLIRVLSLNPWTRFTKGLSWEVHAGTTRIRDAGCKDCLAGQLDVAGGVTTSALDNGIMLFVLGGGEIEGLAPIHGGVGGVPLRLGVGPSGGLRLRLTDHLLAVGRGSYSWLPGQAPKTTWSVAATLRYEYRKDFAFGVEGRKQPSDESVQVMSYLYY